MTRRRMSERRNCIKSEAHRAFLATLPLLLFASACATSQHPAARTLSSEPDETSRVCIRERLVQTRAEGDHERREALVGLLKAVPGALSASKGLQDLATTDERSQLLRALLEMHLEGDQKLAEFTAQLDRGRSLDQVHAETDQYSGLQSVRVLKSALEAALRESLRESARAALESELKSNPDGFLPNRWVANWEQGMRAEYQEAALLVEASPELAQAAFSDVTPSLQQILPEISDCLSGPSIVAHGSVHLEDVPPRRRVSPRSSLRRFLRNRFRSVIRPGQFVRRMLREMEWVKKNRTVRPIVPPPAVHYPDLGTAGNITGNTFPQGAWAITYDDGPGPYTARLLDQLQKRKVSTTFFVLGEMVAFYPKLPVRALAEGHSVNSHSHSHPQIPKIPAADQAKEITAATVNLEKVLGQKTRFFRLPYGAGMGVPAIRQLIRDAGLIHVFWNVDTLDWQIKTIDGIVENTQKQIANLGPSKNRGVILFHDVHERSVGMKSPDGTFIDGASLRVMDALAKDPAVRFVTLPQIVDEMNQASR